MPAKYPLACQFSKSRIRKAGEAIKNHKESVKDMTVVMAWRSSHLYPMQVFANTLRIKSAKYQIDGKQPVVAQRLKRLPTIINKLSRHPNMALERMQDVGGVRVILPSLKELKAILKEYDGIRFNHILDHEKDYIVSPKSDGYRGYHKVYSFRGRGNAKQYNGLKVEIQFRTMLQHEWATAVEVAGTLLGKNFKNGESGGIWSNFFSLMSDIFFLIESNFIKGDEQKKLSLIQKIKKLKTIVSKHKLIDQMMGFSVGVYSHDESVRTGQVPADCKYIVLSLDTESKTVKVTRFKDSESASGFYAELEKNKATNDSVLIYLDELDNLKKAYPNYFLDVEEFCKKVSILMELEI